MNLIDKYLTFAFKHICENRNINLGVKLCLAVSDFKDTNQQIKDLIMLVTHARTSITLHI